MNGIEALQAMKEGKIVIKYEHPMSKKESNLDTLYCFHSKYTEDGSINVGYIWSKLRCEWTWTQCTVGTEFWMNYDGFDVLRDKFD